MEAPMEHVKRVAIFAVVFALLGVVLTSWAAPRYLMWDNTAGSSAAQCICADHARQVANEVLDLQLRGGLGGAAFGLVVGIGFTLWRRAKAKAVTTAPAAPPAPPAAPPAT
jgi:hypothetical protein